VTQQPTRGRSSEYATGNLKDGTHGTGAFLGGRCSIDEVIKFGGILEKSAVGVRSSHGSRLNQILMLPKWSALKSGLISETTATYQVQNHFTFYFTILPNEVVVARASKLGVSLGASPSEVESSVATIKNLDLKRTLIMLKWREDSSKAQDEGNTSSFAINEVTSLCQDLLDNESNEIGCAGSGSV
jgi:hypothetical protein